jgi:hypothetical protein
MGWLLLILLALAAFAAIWRLGRLDRSGLQLLASALLLALAGYSWQGSPGLAGSPRGAAERPPAPETAFASVRFVRHRRPLAIHRRGPPEARRDPRGRWDDPLGDQSASAQCRPLDRIC